MAIVFARIELKGNPAVETYEKLHEYMEGMNWHQHLPGKPNNPMPHAMYQGSFTNVPDLLPLANSLRSAIEKTIWTKAIVLLILQQSSAQSGS